MGLKPEVSIPVALATGTVVYTIYNRGLPSTVDVKIGKQGDSNIDTVRKQNAWMAAAVVSGISLLAKDATVFIVGGAMVVGLDWLTRYANWTNPVSGRLDLNPFGNPERVEGPVDAVQDAPALPSSNGNYQPVV
jgi:hypothetical protein